MVPLVKALAQYAAICPVTRQKAANGARRCVAN
jgi:hypothetical protein